MNISLSEALLRRKELTEKVAQFKQIDVKDLFVTRVQRVKVEDGIDEVVADVPKISGSEVAKAHNYYAKRLRLLDAHIQRMNWTTTFDVDDTLMEDFKDEGDSNKDVIHMKSETMRKG